MNRLIVVSLLAFGCSRSAAPTMTPSAPRSESCHSRSDCARAGIERCETECKGGSLESCVEAGRLAEQTYDLRKMLDSYNAACDGGLLEGCIPEPGIYITSDGIILWDMKRIAAATNRECEKGDRSSCLRLGEIYAGVDTTGESIYSPVKEDLGKAKRSYERACDLGLPRGCVMLAEMFVEGQGGPKDLRRANELFAKACDGDDHGLGCYMLGLSYERGQGIAKDARRARDLYDRGCKRGQELACEALSKSR